MNVGTAPDFLGAGLLVRLAVGDITHGDTSRHTADLVDEAMQEMEDVAGRSLLLGIRCDRLHGQVNRVVELGGGEDG